MVGLSFHFEVRSFLFFLPISSPTRGMSGECFNNRWDYLEKSANSDGIARDEALASALQALRVLLCHLPGNQDEKSTVRR